MVRHAGDYCTSDSGHSIYSGTAVSRS
jgi:hypothetical protein